MLQFSGFPLKKTFTNANQSQQLEPNTFRKSCRRLRLLTCTSQASFYVVSPLNHLILLEFLHLLLSKMFSSFRSCSRRTAVSKFLRNQSTHQNNGRSLNQNHSKRKHTDLTWKTEVGKTTERGEFHYINGDYMWDSLMC